MGIPKSPEKALLFIGTLFSNEDFYFEALNLLRDSFGEIIMESPVFKWDFSDYYTEELGGPIYRRFVFFRNLIQQDMLASIKLVTNDIEMNISSNGKRNINLDPGYLTLSKIVLASTKDYSHRIYLRDGIYAEVTLIFRKGEFVPHLNTYNDYKDERYIKLFLSARNLLRLLYGNDSGFLKQQDY